MSDLPRIEPNPSENARLRLAALVLSIVISLFVTYWAIFGLHSVLDIFFPHVARVPISWALAVLFGMLTGFGVGYEMYEELNSYLEP